MLLVCGAGLATGATSVRACYSNQYVVQQGLLLVLLVLVPMPVLVLVCGAGLATSTSSNASASTSVCSRACY